MRICSLPCCTKCCPIHYFCEGSLGESSNCKAEKDKYQKKRTIYILLRFRRSDYMFYHPSARDASRHLSLFSEKYHNFGVSLKALWRYRESASFITALLYLTSHLTKSKHSGKIFMNHWTNKWGSSAGSWRMDMVIIGRNGREHSTNLLLVERAIRWNIEIRHYWFFTDYSRIVIS